jgi:molybdenum cofactor biosynthesis enzyme
MVKQYEKNAQGQYPFTVIENIRVVKKVKEVNRGEREHKKA